MPGIEILFQSGRRISELILSNADFQMMRAEAERLAPEEACGLLLGAVQGEKSIASRTIPITNSLHSASAYFMPADELLPVFFAMEEENLELVGIYHSHPEGPARPSVTDIAKAYYPEAVQLIWSMEATGWICKGYMIQNGRVESVHIKIEGYP